MLAHCANKFGVWGVEMQRRALNEAASHFKKFGELRVESGVKVAHKVRILNNLAFRIYN